MTARNSLRDLKMPLAWAAAMGTSVALVACGGGGGGASVGAGDGTLRVALTDAPACGYDHVWVSIDKISVNKSATASDTDGGWTDIALSAPIRVDLLSLTNGVLQELGSTPLAAGRYSQIRLVLTSNTGAGATVPNAIQPTGGAVTALTTPSGQQSGLKLQANFDVAPGQLADVVLDFDACKSIVRAGNSGQYLLKPVISVLPRAVAGITGYVATSMPLGSTTVSVQQDGGTTVRSTRPDATGLFSIPYLNTGTYTVVVTSEGHATAVVSSVPVGTGTVALNGTSTAIVTPVSSMADVTGTVVASTLVNGVTQTAVVTDATVSATQSLTGGPVVTIASQSVDATAATYRLHLPVAAPVKAPYVAASAPVFTADTAVAGKYTLSSQSPTRAATATSSKPVDISAGTGLTLNLSY